MFGLMGLRSAGGSEAAPITTGDHRPPAIVTPTMPTGVIPLARSLKGPVPSLKGDNSSPQLRKGDPVTSDTAL